MRRSTVLVGLILVMCAQLTHGTEFIAELESLYMTVFRQIISVDPIYTGMYSFAFPPSCLCAPCGGPAHSCAWHNHRRARFLSWWKNEGRRVVSITTRGFSTRQPTADPQNSSRGWGASRLTTVWARSWTFCTTQTNSPVARSIGRSISGDSHSPAPLHWVSVSFSWQCLT